MRTEEASKEGSEGVAALLHRVTVEGVPERTSKLLQVQLAPCCTRTELIMKLLQLRGTTGPSRKEQRRVRTARHPELSARVCPHLPRRTPQKPRGEQGTEGNLEAAPAKPQSVEARPADPRGYPYMLGKMPAPAAADPRGDPYILMRMPATAPAGPRGDPSILLRMPATAPADPRGDP